MPKATPKRVPPIKQVTYISVPPSRVYDVLSSGEGWDAWFTSGTEIIAESGGAVRFRWRDFGPQHETIEDGGPVLKAIPNRELTFQWSPGDSVTTVRIKLKRRGCGTLVELVESGYHMTTKGLEALVGCATGWGEALTLLKFYLEHGITYGPTP